MLVCQWLKQPCDVVEYSLFRYVHIIPCSHTYPLQSYVSLAVIRKWRVLLRNITVSIVIVYTWFNQKKKTTLLASQKQARSGKKI